MFKIIFDQLQQRCAQERQIRADLSGSTYGFPLSVASTDMCSNLVMKINSEQVVILVVELTVCFETNFVDASLRKAERYQNLLDTCTANRYCIRVAILEIVS